MKIRKNTLLLTASFFLLFTSCEKIIETEDPSNQIASTEVFTDVQTANAALAGLYGSLWNVSLISGGNEGMGALLGSYTDDLKCFYTTNSNGALDVYNNVHNASNPAVEKVWTTAYQQIYVANSIIEGIQSAPFADVEKKRIAGEALFVRSLLYFYLVQIFGDIPYAISTDYQLNGKLAKTPYAKMLQNLESDIILSVEMLPEQYRSMERIYPNKKVAQLLLIKLKLLQENWVQTENLCKAFLQNNTYSFENNITKVFNKSSPHIIWQLKPKNIGDPVKEYSLYYFVNSAPNAYALQPSTYTFFDNADLRKMNWLTSVTANQQTYYRINKYKNPTGSNTTEYSVIFRLEELYFIIAESLLQQDKTIEALHYINATKIRAGLLPLSSVLTKSQAFEELKAEKRREFFAEMGHRFFDLKRWNLTNNITNVKPNWSFHHKLWPIPSKELILNPNLLPQNEGY